MARHEFSERSSDMELDDSAANARIASLTRLTGELEQSRTPFETLQAIRRALRDMEGPVTSLMLSTRGLGDGEYRVVQLQVDDAAPVPDSDPWTQGMSPVQRGGLIARIIEKREPRIMQDADWTTDPYFHDSLAGYGAIIAIPFAGDHLPMNWVMLLRRHPGCFTAFDLEQSVLRAALIGSLLESQGLTQEVADAHLLIDREIQRVGEIQRMLLPDPLPEIPGLEIAASYETFGEAGGDLYDFIRLDRATSERERWAIFIGDASGHGPSAAVVIAIVQAVLHAHPPGVISPAALLQHVNEHLCRRPIEASFVTAFLGVYDRSSRCLTFASAGHPPPLLLRATPQAAKWLDSVRGYPLGINAAQVFQDASVEFETGDMLLLYTDGVTEARNQSGAMFGIEGIQVAVRDGPRAPHELAATIRQAITAHENGRRPNDDQTLVIIGAI